jgi:hypothetical protein
MPSKSPPSPTWSIPATRTDVVDVVRDLCHVPRGIGLASRQAHLGALRRLVVAAQLLAEAALRSLPVGRPPAP